MRKGRVLFVKMKELVRIAIQGCIVFENKSIANNRGSVRTHLKLQRKSTERKERHQIPQRAKKKALEAGCAAIGERLGGAWEF